MNDKLKKLPGNVSEAVDQLLSELTLKDKTVMVEMESDDLVDLNASYGSYIRSAFGLWSGNKELMESCRFVSGEKDLNADGASYVIIESLWKKLLQTHPLKIVK